MTTGECDCCGKLSNTIARCWYGNIETFTCAECRGIDHADYSEEEESEKEKDNYAMNSYEIRKHTGIS